MVSGDKNIYLVNDEYARYFNFNLIDLADTSDLAAVQFDSSIATYFGDTKVLESFDKITVSGKKFNREMVITPNPNPEQSDIVPFVVTSPQNRYADNIDSLVSTSHEGIVNTMEKLNAINFEALNKTIEDLSAVVERLAKISKIFG
jgi:hypothetical protein